MKTKIKIIAKALFLVVLLSSSAIALNVVGVKVVSEAHASVSQEQVYQYLISRGYLVVSLKKESNERYCNNWVAHTIKGGLHFTTTVYCNENEIIGHGDVPF
ncbi:MAG: hypothetical protein J0L87_11030 [Bacteroidetes bacterium]|nr:hypothetical protein [Bacteroidota bacterium]